MSLLQKASIITTPTAYAEDYLYSIKPAYALGTELVTNGNFATDSDWGKGSGWTILGGKANRSGESGNTPITQNVPVVNGRKYTFSYTRKYLSGSSGHTNIFVKLDNVNYSTIGAYISTVVEEHTVTGEFTALFTGNLLWQIYGIGDFTGYVDNVSIKEITDADFDFTRNSTGSRVNEDYLIEDVPYNLSTYSEDFPLWSSTGTITRTSNIAIAPDGTLTADGIQDTTGSSFKRVRTNISVSGNSTFTGSCFIKKVSSETGNTGFALVFTGTSTKVAYGIIDSVNGTMISQSSTITPVFKIESANNDYWRFSMTATDTGSNTSLEFSIYGTLSSNGTSVSAGAGSLRTIWGAQLVKGDQPKDYLKTTDRLDIPRIDYTNGEPSILLEPQRTNLVRASQDFSDVNWSNQQTTESVNVAISPEGLLNASKLIEDSSNNRHIIFDALTSSAGTVYTFSVFLKKGERNYATLRLDDDSPIINTWFDLESGTVGTMNSESASIEDYGNGWYRCSVQYTAEREIMYAVIATATSDNVLYYQGDGTSGIFMYGAQVEAGSYATSLIHTSGSAVTRSADAANNAGNSDLINSTEGVLYAEFKGQNDNTFNYISVSDGGTTNYAAILCSDVDNEIAYRYYVSNSGVQIVTSVSNLLEFNKIAVKWKVNDFSIYINGVQVGASTSGSVNSAGTFNNVSFARGTSNNTPFYGNFKSVMVFKEALTDLELEKLTGYNNHELYMNYYNRLSYLGLVEEYNVESDINNYIL